MSNYYLNPIYLHSISKILQFQFEYVLLIPFYIIFMFNQ